MSRAYNVAEAKAHFSELIQRALDGEEVIIARDNKPLLRLVPLRTKGGDRKPGSGRGQIAHMADDFNETPHDFDDYAR